MGHGTAPNYGSQPSQTLQPYDEQVLASLLADADAVCARYPHKRSALLPLLHLVQSVDGYISTRGIEFCAQVLDLSAAEVSGVATFYTQYKRHRNGEYTVGVCVNTLCAVMGGDAIWEAVSAHLGVGHDETTADGRITLERLECNAACDYAPVVMTNWEFFDTMTPQSTIALVDDLRAGRPVHPSRGAQTVATFTEISRVLAGFPDGRHDEGVGAGEASLTGLRLAHERGWTAPGEGGYHAGSDEDSSPQAATDAHPKTGQEHSSAQRSGSDERKTTS
ncbi:MAG: NADH-quinone oxidoreductase subunit NuoE [Austwickia sp.]|jgi:NADH-quinone oxidoreductase subunit E|nr:NADH-quinone oxidoreductase subunit NuoE [Austwickia sp.]MBK8436123.1 NADH-quinone oxidoreductase subunit NuoE [Austwickia sp.]MBK9101802.1 NADH-quinone oxidoreductase subunit NuoE [Austwickia sp.]